MSAAVSLNRCAAMSTIDDAPTQPSAAVVRVAGYSVRHMPAHQRPTASHGFPARFDAAITERSLSEDDTARLLGVTQASVNRWRTGKLIPSREKAPVVAQFLRIHLGELEAMLDRTHDSHDVAERGTFGALLRQLEDQHGLDPIGMVEKYGMERSKYYRWRGNLSVPKPEHIAGLAELLGVREERIVLACYKTLTRSR